VKCDGAFLPRSPSDCAHLAERPGKMNDATVSLSYVQALWSYSEIVDSNFAHCYDNQQTSTRCALSVEIASPWLRCPRMSVIA